MSKRHPSTIFLVGKGGVGKSTISALTALNKSRHSSETLLVSMDPAHNQADILRTKLVDRPYRIEPNLQAMQVDLERQIKAYLQETEENIRRRYSYHTAFNIKNHFKSLQFSPGIEEYALLQAFGSILKSHGDKDFIIFDMPPTAMTLRFFSLPGTTLTWLSELITLREKIFSKQQIVSNIKWGKKDIETDPVLARLRKMKTRYENISRLLHSESLKIRLVTRPDELAMAESKRIYNKLCDLGLTIDKAIINGSTEQNHPEMISKAIPAEGYVQLPLHKTSLTGIPALEAYLSSNPEPFSAL